MYFAILSNQNPIAFSQKNMIWVGVNPPVKSGSTNPVENTSSTPNLTSGNTETTGNKVKSDEQISRNISAEKGLARLDALVAKSLLGKSQTTNQLKGLPQGGNISAEKGLARLDALVAKSLLGKSQTTNQLKGLPQGGAVFAPPPVSNVVVTVTFDSITVHNRHDIGSFNDGEYYLVAYVQGKKVDLTHASGPGAGLWDVSDGETLTFKQNNVAITEIPNNIPLSIFTVGIESDAAACDKGDYMTWDNVQAQRFRDDPQHIWPLFDAPVSEWPTKISKLQKMINSFLHCAAVFDDDDTLGTISKIYDPPSYGAGAHTNVVSSNGDFTLRYTISKGDACNASIC
jgi:hypothetical protein